MTIVLFYHQVAPPSPEQEPLVSPEAFRRQLDHLVRSGLAPVTLDDAVAGRDGFSITFDDGYLNVMEHAVPALTERRASAAFFVIPRAIGKTDDWHCNREPILDWPHLRELHRLGFTIGSHSQTHVDLTGIPLEAARREMVDSKKALEDGLGAPVRHFAFPKGRYTPELAKLVGEAGYAAGWATKKGDGTPFARRRFPVGANAGMLRFRWRLRRMRWGMY